MLTVYGIKNCNTMQKAMAWLDANGVTYIFHDYKKSGAYLSKLIDWIAKTSVDAIVNTKGLTYKKLSDADKQKALSVKGAVDLLQQHTSMIKRPIADNGAVLLIGFDEAEWRKALL
ncbi:MAG: Spx/MgsR family RNA polymerase-binding regulatory protein [Bacteroidota bacterium]|jgi:arsenate reductase